ncbi:MAG: aminoacyl-tRNA deacylase [Chloroflexi bacterium]|nr:aminoacyl-tRNA deacylase [Chloroflexota bacterium]
MARKSKDKTQAIRLLESKKIAFTSHSYDPDVFVSATEVADAVGMPAAQVFKTLVTAPDTGKPILAALPADAELDLKVLAKAAGVKKVKMASQADAERWTGLKKGGISALALVNRGFKVFLNRSAYDFDRFAVSAGERGTQVVLAPADFVQITGASVVKITR